MIQTAPKKVDVHLGAKFGLTEFLDEPVLAAAGVVHHHVQPAEVVVGALDGGETRPRGR